MGRMEKNILLVEWLRTRKAFSEKYIQRMNSIEVIKFVLMLRVTLFRAHSGSVFYYCYEKQLMR